MREDERGLRASPSILETVLKYSATLGALSYGAGFVASLEMFDRYPSSASDLAYNSPEILGTGASILTVFAGVVFAPFVYLLAVKIFLPISQLVEKHTQKFLLAAMVTGVLLSCLVVYGQSLVMEISLRDTVFMILVLATVSATTNALLLRQGSDIGQSQGLLVILFLLGLLSFSTWVGRGLGGVVAVRKPTVRLLIAPEAVTGLQAMGVPFQQPLTPGKDTGITGAVKVLMQSESSYLVLMPDGRVAKLRKEKVWAIMPEQK